MNYSAWPGPARVNPGSTVYQGDRVHVMGDSLTYYGWYTPLETLVAATKDETGVNMSVAWTANGVPGIQTPGIKSSLATMLTPYSPDFLIVETGRNDDAVEAVEYGYVVSLIDAIRAWKPSQRMVFVSVMWAGEIWKQTGVLPPAWDNTAHGGYDDALIASENRGAQLACSNRGVPWIDARSYVLGFEPNYNPSKLAFGAPEATMTNDGTHPNATNGQPAMSQGVFNCLSFGSAALKVTAR